MVAGIAPAVVTDLAGMLDREIDRRHRYNGPSGADLLDPSALTLKLAVEVVVEQQRLGIIALCLRADDSIACY